jgi:protoporphyrinogen oxidase
MAGFGAAHRLYGEGLKPVIYEMKPHYGGHTESYRTGSGFIFDEGPHVSFTKVDRMQRLFAESVQHDYQRLQARVNNYWKGKWIKHPAQCNLYGLPEELIVEILRDFIEAKYKQLEPINSYADWLVASYGKTFAETFPMRYGLKYHTTPASNMTIDWLGPRLYTPSVEEVLRGALSPKTPDVHYIDHFRYPTHGGFVSYLNLFRDEAELRLNHRLVALDPFSRELHFANGVIAPYDHVISSIPLPELIPLIVEAPDDVKRAANQLTCSSVVLVNIGIDREDISEAHWSYFYDQDFFFTRVSYPHMFSPWNAPPGAGSIQAEVYYSTKYRPLDRSPQECIEPVMSDLHRCGLLRENDRILSCEAKLIPYANVIFDLDRPAALATVHGYLDDVGLVYCGRYGEWGYHWTDEAFLSGENAAQKALDRSGSRLPSGMSHHADTL